MATIARAAAMAAMLLTLLGGCLLFTATSDFYVDNRSGSSITVAWKDVDAKKGSVEVAAGDKAKLTSKQLIESDVVLPSAAFSWLKVSVDGTVVYTQDPIDDDAWKKTAGSGDKEYTFTLIVTDSDL